MDTNKYIDEILIKNNTLTDEGREIVIEEIIALQDSLKHVKEKKSIFELTRYTDKGLVLTLMAGHEFFAIKHFLECGRNPATCYKDI